MKSKYNLHTYKKKQDVSCLSVCISVYVEIAILSTDMVLHYNVASHGFLEGICRELTASIPRQIAKIINGWAGSFRYIFHKIKHLNCNFRLWSI